MRGAPCCAPSRAVRRAGSARHCPSGRRHVPVGRPAPAHAPRCASEAICRRALGHVIAAPNAGSAATSGSRRAFGRPVGNLEPRDLGATAPIESRSPVPTRSSAASEGGSDVVQGSDQANLLLAGEPVDVRPRWDFRRTRPPPFGDPWRRVGGQLVPRGAQRLQRLLQRFKRARCAGMSARLSSCGVERPRGFRELGRPFMEELWRIHAADGRRPTRLRAWGPMPNCPRPSPHPNRRASFPTVVPRGECMRDPGCTSGPMAPRPPQLKDGAYDYLRSCGR